MVELLPSGLWRGTLAGVTRAQFTAETDAQGAWVRQSNAFVQRVTAERSGPFPVESGRYHLIVSLACPWAHRSVIVRRILGLDEHISLTVVDPIRDEKGWRFSLSPDGIDPISGAAYLSELYVETDPSFHGRWTVPVLWDRKTRRIVSNDFPRLTLDFATEWRSLHRSDAPDLYPERLRSDIDHINSLIYSDVNDGVYRCGFAVSQEAYNEAYQKLFSRLDWLSELLAKKRYLVGDQLTEADIRLFTTLVRFDAVYHSHFKCNRQKLSEMPILWAYARDVYQTPGFGATVDFGHIKRHYYGTHHQINPTGIIPRGPDASGWLIPHQRS